MRWSNTANAELAGNKEDSGMGVDAMFANKMFVTKQARCGAEKKGPLMQKTMRTPKQTYCPRGEMKSFGATTNHHVASLVMKECL